MATRGTTTGTMTAAVKGELARAAVGTACCRRAEVATVLRFAGGVELDGSRVVVGAELDTPAAAQRLRTMLAVAFAQPAQLAVSAPAERRREGHRWVVRVTVGGESLARRAGLVDERGLAVRGLPPQVIAGALCDAEAIWRGALLAFGSLSETGKTRALTVTCSGADATLLSLALTGAARRLGVRARARQVHGVEQVSIADPDEIAVLLTRLGAPEAARAWQERQRARAVAAEDAGATRVQNFSTANLTRSTVAARAAAGQLARALEILGADVPAHLGAAARLRIAHPDLSLDRLGALCDPPMTKDAIAGRIRRVLALADKRSAALGMTRSGDSAESPSVVTPNPPLTPRCQEI